MTRQHLEQRLRDLTRAEPSDELRRRVLSVRAIERPIDWIDRLWFSRVWRVSMTAAAFVIVLVGQWAAARPELREPPDETLAQTHALRELLQQSGIPPAEAAPLMRRATARRQISISPTSVDDLFRAEGVHQ